MKSGKIGLALAAVVVMLAAELNGNDYTAVDRASELREHVDKKVRVTGTISNVPWQHMIASVKGYPFDQYFDFDDYQIVIYAKEKIGYKGMITVYGTVIEVGGESKNPRRKETAVEYHIRVDMWERAD